MYLYFIYFIYILSLYRHVKPKTQDPKTQDCNHYHLPYPSALY